MTLYHIDMLFSALLKQMSALHAIFAGVRRSHPCHDSRMRPDVWKCAVDPIRSRMTDIIHQRTSSLVTQMAQQMTHLVATVLGDFICLLDESILLEFARLQYLS